MSSRGREGVFFMAFVKSLNHEVNVAFTKWPTSKAQCHYCVFKIGEESCNASPCHGGLYLTEERYLRAKLLGIENLEPV